MKISQKIIIFLIFPFFSAVTIFAMQKKFRLSAQEEKTMIEKRTLPQSYPVVKENLDTFFRNTNVRTLFVDVAARNYTDINPHTGKKTKPADLETLKKNFGTYKYENKESEKKQLFDQICKEFKLEVLYTKPGNRLGGTYLLASDVLFPGFILKIPRFRWIDIQEWRENDLLIPSPYQNVSRVFYTDALEELVKQREFKHISVVQEYLYHIPQQPYELDDENYIVVSEKIPNLPSPEDNGRRFKQLVARVDNNTPKIIEEYRPLRTLPAKRTFLQKLCDAKEFAPLLDEFLQTIILLGMWDISPTNTFLLNDQSPWNVVFIDTEKPGYGGGDLKHFFHKNKTEIERNAEAGFDSFMEKIMVPQLMPKHSIMPKYDMWNNYRHYGLILLIVLAPLIARFVYSQWPFWGIES